MVSIAKPLGMRCGTLRTLYGLMACSNVDSEYYRNSGPPSEEANDVDKGVINFFAKCANVSEGQSANQCAWTTPVGQQRTPESLLTKFSDWVGAEPLGENRGRATLPPDQSLSADESYIVRSLLFETLRDPSDFVTTARILQYWYDSNARIPEEPISVEDAAATLPTAATRVKPRQAPVDAFDPTQATAAPNKAPNAIFGISCLDGQYRPADLSNETYAQVYNAYSAKTKFGTEKSVVNVYACM
jgi:hypothetical protein